MRTSSCRNIGFVSANMGEYITHGCARSLLEPVNQNPWSEKHFFPRTFFSADIIFNGPKNSENKQEMIRKDS